MKSREATVLKINNFNQQRKHNFAFLKKKKGGGLLQSEFSKTVLYLVTGPMVHYEDGRTLLDANLTSKIVFICFSFLPFMVKNLKPQQHKCFVSSPIPISFSCNERRD